jgi:hypothetical protein
MGRQTIEIVYGADARKFNRTSGQVRESMKRFAKLSAAGLAATVAAYGKLMAAATEYGDNIDKTSRRTGIAAEQLQRLAFAAELSGANMEGVEKSVKRMAGVVGDMRNGLSTASDSFRDLGLSLEDVDGKTPEQQLMVFLDALSRIDDKSRRIDLAADIFGKGGTGLLPIIDGGSAAFRELLGEADKVNGVLSQDLIDGAAKLTDSFSRVKLALKAMAFREVLTDASSFSDKLDELSVKIAEFGKSDEFANMVDNMRAFAAVLGMIAKVLGTIVGLFVKLGELVGEHELFPGLNDFLEKTFFAKGFGGGVQQRNFDANQLTRGTGQFGAVDKSLSRDQLMEMIKRDGGLKVIPAGGGV